MARDAAEAALARVLREARACTLCAPHLPLGPRPVLRGRASARLLVLSQAPGTQVHETGLSFNDRSGDRLREWMGIEPRRVLRRSPRRHHADGPLLSRPL